MAEQRATTISVKALSDAVAKAVARERDKHVLSEQFTIDHNLIMGRWLREELSLKDAEAFASRITTAVQQSHVGEQATSARLVADHALDPVVFALRGRVILGFIWNQRVILGE